MVKPFQFCRLPKIIFGAGKISELPGLINTYGKSVLIVTGRQSFSNSSFSEHLIKSLDLSGTGHSLVNIQKEPSPDDIDHIINSFMDKAVDLIIGIGGGSVLDAGKAVSAMMYKTESVMEYLEGVGTREHPGSKIPFIAIPTTSGTGSEATKNAVLSQIGENGFKKSLRHDNLVPDIALVDPELTLKCPREITTASGMDCFTQLTESFLSDKANEYTDALALEGLKAIKRSLFKCYEDGTDIEARSDMSFAALTSGICLANAGLGVIHGFASSIGGMYDVPHGVICGTLMAASNEINVRELRKKPGNRVPLKKYVLLGKLFLDEKGKSEDYYIDGFIQYLYKLTMDFKLPGLKKFGLSESGLSSICQKTEIKNNPVSLTIENLIEILSCRLL
jgi:alcohol dehydrogenase class IV